MTRELTNTLAAFAAAVSLNAAAQAQHTIDRTLPAQPNVEIGVENIAGRVTVQVGENNQVRLHAVLGADVDDLEVSGDESGYYFEIEVDEDHHDKRRRKIDLASTIELWVPVGASVEIETVSAGVEVRGTTGGASVESVSGAIDLIAVGGGIEADSVSGAITIDSAGGPVWAEAVSGQVEISGARDEVHAEAVSGSVRISNFRGGEVHVETVSGAIRFEGELSTDSDDQAELSVETVSGSVELHLPADLRADFDIETFSGSIHSDFGGDVKQVSRYGPGKYLGYSTGDDAEICIETLSGGVTLSHR